MWEQSPPHKPVFWGCDRLNHNRGVMIEHWRNLIHVADLFTGFALKKRSFGLYYVCAFVIIYPAPSFIFVMIKLWLKLIPGAPSI